MPVIPTGPLLPPRQPPRPPWMAPWYRAPADQPRFGYGIGSGRTNEPYMNNTPRIDSGHPYVSERPDLMRPWSGKAPDYNVPQPPIMSYGAPWYGQPRLPHEVSAFEGPSPWMTQDAPGYPGNPGHPTWQTYQPSQLPSPLFYGMPAMQPQPMPWNPEGGWKTQPDIRDPALGRYADNQGSPVLNWNPYEHPTETPPWVAPWYGMPAFGR